MAARAVLQAGHESAARSPAALQQQRSSASALRGWLDFMTLGKAAQGAMQMAKHAPTEVCAHCTGTYSISLLCKGRCKWRRRGDIVPLISPRDMLSLPDGDAPPFASIRI